MVQSDQEQHHNNSTMTGSAKGKTGTLQFNYGCPVPTFCTQEGSFTASPSIVTEGLASQYSVGPFTTSVNCEGEQSNIGTLDSDNSKVASNNWILTQIVPVTLYVWI